MTPQELKNSVLQRAIQGKLVEQRPEEGTGEDLYQAIQAEKRRLIQSGKLKKEKPSPEITEDEIPFDIPDSWKWVRLGYIGNTNIGLTYTPQDISQNGTIVLRSGNIKNGKMDYSDLVKVSAHIPENKLCHKGDILICARNGSKNLVGKAAIIDRDGMSFGAFMAVFKSMCNDYIFHIICSAYFRNSLLQDTGTTTINQITQEMLKNVVVPLPPLAEQRRIVAKIEELTPYIDRYTAAWNRLEDFNKRFPSDMRKSLLQRAIQGKLVEQRPEEGTGEELYRTIQAEKQRLIKSGKLKKDKPLPEISDDEIPFDIPDSWTWVRFNHLMSFISTGPFGSMLHKSDYVPDGIPLVNPANIINGSIVPSSKIMVDGATVKRLESYALRTGMIVMGRRGEMGRCAVITEKEDGWLCGTGSFFMQPLSSVDVQFVRLFFSTPYARNYLGGESVGTTMSNLNHSILMRMPVPFPPLAEQCRIVARLKELLPLCESLK